MSVNPPSDAVAALVQELVVANRILAREKVVDAFGHVSVRHPELPDRFLLSRSLAPAMVTASDILTFDFEGRVVGDRTERPYLERFIHAAIYRARGDVHAVVHSHSPNVIAFGAARRPLRPVYHMAGFLGSGSAHFDIRDVAGDTDMLVRDVYLGEALARSLGGRSLVLMRGHGSTVTGPSLRVAVARAVYAETNARLQAQAEAMGEVRFLNEAEAAAAAEANDGQVDRAWNLWVDELRGVSHPL